MSKIKVLTIQFDVTHLDNKAIESLRTAAVVQGEEFEVYDAARGFGSIYKSADLLNTSVREVDTEEQ